MKAGRFSDYLKTGSILWLQLGTPRLVVLEHLGVPQHWTDKDYGESMLAGWAYHYEELKIIFKGDRVEAINVSVSRPDEPCVLSWEDEMVPAETTVEEFKRFLHRQDIEAASPSPHKKFDPMESVFITSGGVCVYAMYDVDYTELGDGSLSCKRSPVPYVATFVRKAPGPEAKQ
jgi:hypothetical protein